MVIGRVLLGVSLWLALETPSLWAQFAQNPYSRAMPLPQPAVSPYLNLLRQGNSAAFNYFTLVRPELDTLKSLDQLNTQTLQTGSNQTTTTAAGELITSHAFGFQTQRRYFMTLGGGRSLAGGARPNTGMGAGQGLGGMGGQNTQGYGGGSGLGTQGFGGNAGITGVPGIR
ncbi:MAG TPA: hypothetical protein VNX28_06210 [Gemmataceae bacterium]|jgi:hypothetical protein|nr:hypothetical protein [Gemmataceae bacterium]